MVSGARRRARLVNRTLGTSGALVGISGQNGLDAMCPVTCFDVTAERRDQIQEVERWSGSTSCTREHTEIEVHKYDVPRLKDLTKKNLVVF